ncbi:MAG: 50S ribosomal protein L20 [Ktedonobacterales bacterium]|nr:50S ribosomal protein L20 [Ktedonobacterales bacterium]
MPRVKRGITSRKRHKKVFRLTEGHKGVRHTHYKVAHESMMKALAYSYRDRRNRKRDFRRLWITRINAASRMHGVTYSQFMHGLSLAGIMVNRKVLADLAVYNSAVFAALVGKATDALKPQA